MSARRQYAHKRQDIFKKSYDDIIKSAKRKHTTEFYIFQTKVGDEIWFSECSVDAYNTHMEYWKKLNGKWRKIGKN